MYVYRSKNEGLEVVGDSFCIKNWFFGSVTSRIVQVAKAGRLKLVRYIVSSDELSVDDIWDRRDDKGHMLKKQDWKVRGEK